MLNEENLEEGLQVQPGNSQEALEGDNPPEVESEIDYKKRYSDSTREAQKLMTRLNQTEELLINTNVDRILVDPSYLEKLGETDRQLAEKVARKLTYDGVPLTSYEEALQYINGTPPSKNQTSINEDDLFEKWEKRQISKQTKDFVSDYIAKLPESIRDEVEEDYKEIVGSKFLTPEQAKKYLDMVNTYKNKDSIKSNQIDKFNANMASSNINSVSKSEKVSKGTEELAKTLGLTHLISNKK